MKLGQLADCSGKHRQNIFNIFDSAITFAVASIVIIASNLGIFWNDISSVRSITLVGSLIPTVAEWFQAQDEGRAFWTALDKLLVDPCRSYFYCQA
jgi:hypothetical protein